MLFFFSLGEMTDNCVIVNILQCADVLVSFQ